jgi:cyclopropane-fatty-acyl-phospholipid synthase
MDRLLQLAVSTLVRRGTLQVTTARGRTFRVGDGTGRPVAVRFTNAAAERALLLDPELKLGELYVDRGVVVEQGSISELLDLIVGNLSGPAPAWGRTLRRIRSANRRIFQRNSIRAAGQNAAHHYDIDGQLYQLFLDSDRQYSCAYFESPTATLEEAQAAKKRHLAAKLLLKPRQRVLDIGSGWGGLALALARSADVHVTGVTLSHEQLAAAQSRAKQAGLNDQVDFQFEDYRNIEGRFDRIVSVGMFEHVGKRHYQTFFDKCFSLLEDDGVMVLHTVGRLDGPYNTNPWISRYIFPGGHAPALSEIAPPIEQSGLIVSDIEVLRIHYAETLRHWRQRFMAQREKVLELFDERFIRMWEFYLAGFEAYFRYNGLAVFQIQLAKKNDTVPLTRDYLYGERPFSPAQFEQAAE